MTRERLVKIIFLGCFLSLGGYLWADEDSLNIRFLGSCDLPGNNIQLWVSGNYAYVVGDSGFHIIDVSDPRNPKWISSCSLGIKCYYLPPIHGIAVQNDFVYIAGYPNVSIADTGYVIIINISNPEEPKEIGRCKVPNSERIRVQGNYAYTIARKLEHYPSENRGLDIIDISDPQNPQRVGFYRMLLYPPLSLWISNKYCYIGTRGETDFSFNLVILDISDPIHPQKVGSWSTGNAAQWGISGIWVWNNYAILSSSSPSYLWILDISAISKPQRIGSWSGVSCEMAYNLYGQGSYVYLPWGGHGLWVVDISNPEDPELIGFYWPYDGGVPLAACDIFAKEQYIYVVPGEWRREGLSVLEFYDEGVREERSKDNYPLKMEAIPLDKTTVAIRYSLPSAGFYSLGLYDSTGRLLKVLDSGFKETGNYSLSCSIVNFSSGVYFLRLTTKEASVIKKITRIK